MTDLPLGQLRQTLSLGVIGFGNIAEAIVTRLEKEDLIYPRDIITIETNKERARHIKRKYGVTVLKDYTSLCARASVILLAVKPQNINDVLPFLKKHHTNQLILTVVTGVAIKKYEKELGENIRIIRIMPNTPALIGLGMSAYFANKKCTDKDKWLCHKIFACVGNTLEIKSESLLDPITATSGSGPAYVYQFAQSLIDAAIGQGIKPAVAKTLILETLRGATEMMMVSKESIDDLTNRVATKGGTTEAGIKVLKKEGFYKAINGCVKAATKRAKELSK
jgi:pyrroline-5-carboxylate reductase